MSDYREKLSQAETNATKIVDELNKLKAAVKGYQTSTETMEKVSTKLDLLISKQQSIADAQLAHVKAMEKLGFADLIESLEKQFKNISGRFNTTYVLIGLVLAIVLWTMLMT